METEIVGGSAVTKAAWLALLVGELQELIMDARWLILAVLVCIVADFRLGRGEAAKRFSQAEADGNRTLMDKYKWRGSRAWRRSVNKVFDYLLWIIVGEVVGKALLSEVGVDYSYGGIVMAGVAIACEAGSLFGHFFYLHGVAVEKKTVMGFCRAFMVALVKKKNEDVGEALDEALK